MSLSKEQQKKLMLGGLFGAALIYGYFEFGLGPLNTKQTAAKREIVTLTPKLADANKKIASRDALKAKVPQAEAYLNQIDQMIPEGSPVAWFPTLVGEFFKAKSGERVTTRLLNDVADPAVDGYKRLNWTVEIPKADAMEFAGVLADFENKQPLVEVPSFIIEFIQDEPQHQRITLNLTNSVKK